MAFTPNYFSQQDPEWKNIKLGFGSVTIGTDGCAITSLAMLVKGFGYDETPKTVNQKLKDLGEQVGFYSALVVWGALPRLFPRIKYKNMRVCREETVDAPIAEIDAALNNGQPVIVETDRSLASGLQNHWVVLYAKQGDDYLMLDPWPYPSDNKDTLLTVRYGFGRPAEKIITAVIWYEGQSSTTPTPITPPPPVVETGFYVNVLGYLTGGLRLRSAATTDSDTLAVEPAGASLRVIEPESGAFAKIGVEGQWLRVRDPQGLEGYVAAWYVEAAQSTTPTPEEPTPAPTEPEQPTEPETPAEPEPTPIVTIDAQALIDAVNNLRVNKGLSPYKINDTLNSIAQQQAVYMASSGQVTHLNANGKRPFQRALDAGYELSGDLSQGGFMSENILAGLGTGADTAIALWQTDTAHTNTMLSGTYTEVGAGMARAGDINYLCLDAARPTSASTPVTPTPPVEEPEPEPETPTPEPEPPPQPTTLKVAVLQSATNGLRMRAQPSLGGSLVTVLKAGTELTVQENADTARAKIGVTNQWLHVSDPMGRVGYVAAWFVEEVDSPTGEGTPATPTQPTPSSLTVFVSAQATAGLRMRSGPSTSTAVVKILPANSRLTVLEPSTTAEAKIGQNNQWLNVKDTAGVEGYVAAWYVVK